MINFDEFPNGNFSSGLSVTNMSVNSSTRFDRLRGNNSKRSIFKRQRLLRYRNGVLENLFAVYFYEDRTSILACWVCALSLGLPSGLPSMLQSETARLALSTMGPSIIVWCIVCVLTYALLRQRKSLLDAAHHPVRSGTKTAAAPVSRLWLIAKPFSSEWVLQANAKQQELLVVLALLGGLLYASYTYPARTVKCDPRCWQYVDVDSIVLFFLPITVVVSPLRIALLAPVLVGIITTFFATRFIPGSLPVSFSLFSSFALVALAATILTIISAFFNERWRRDDFERIYLMHLDGELMATTRDIANTSVGYVIPADVARRVAAGEVVIEVSSCASVAMFAFRNYYKESTRCGAAELVQRQQWLAMILDASKETHRSILKFHNRGDVYMVACGPFASSILNLPPEPQTSAENDLGCRDRRRMLATMLFEFATDALAQLLQRIEDGRRPSNPLLEDGQDDATVAGTQHAWALSRDVVCALDSSLVTCLYRSSPANCLVLGNAIDGCRQLLRAADDATTSHPSQQRHRTLVVSEAFEEALRPRGGGQGVLFVDSPCLDAAACSTPIGSLLKRIPVRSAVVASRNAMRQSSLQQPEGDMDEEDRSAGHPSSDKHNHMHMHGAPLAPPQRPVTPGTSNNSDLQPSQINGFYCSITPGHTPTATASQSESAVLRADAASVAPPLSLVPEDDEVNDVQALATSSTFWRIALEVRMDRSCVGLLSFRRQEMENGYTMHLKELAARGYTQWMFACCAFMSLVLIVVSLIYRFGADQAEQGIAPLGGALFVDIMSFFLAVYHSNGEAAWRLVFVLLFWTHCALWYFGIALEPSGSLLHDEQLLWSCVVIMLGLLREPQTSFVLACVADLIGGAPMMVFALVSDRTTKMKAYIIAGQVVIWLISVTTRVLLDRSLREQFAARVQSLLYADELEKDYEAMTDLLTSMVPQRLAVRIMDNVKDKNPRTSLAPLKGGKRVRASCGAGMGVLQDAAAGSCVVFPHVESVFTSRTLDTPFAIIALRPRAMGGVRASRRSSPRAGGPAFRPPHDHMEAPQEASIEALVRSVKQLSDVWSDIQTTLREQRSIVAVMFTGDSCLLVDEENSFDHKFSSIFEAVRCVHATVVSAPHSAFVDFKVVLHSGPVMGAVVGKLALSFEFYGESIGTAKTLIDEMSFNGVVATERYCEQLRLTWLHGCGGPVVLLPRADADVSMHAVARWAPPAKGASFSERQTSWKIRGRCATLHVRSIRFLQPTEHETGRAAVEEHEHGPPRM